MVRRQKVGMAADSQEEIIRFSQSKLAPDGEWWAEFLVGLSLEEMDAVNQPVNRLIDGVCIISHSSREVDRLYKDDMRERRKSGWLDNEDVVLVEYGRGTGAWAKYGQLDVRRRMFEQDWENANIDSALLVMEVHNPDDYGREDTRWIFENELEDYEYVVEFEGDYYRYSSFIDEFC